MPHRTRPFDRLTRRQVLGLASTGAAGILLGCETRRGDVRGPERPDGADGAGAATGDGAAPPYGYGDSGVPPYGYGDARAPRPVTDGAACSLTDENILGPYYKAGAPFRADIRDGQVGDLLYLSGVVRAADCATPLAGALVDVWQANADGAYDGVGYTLRGRLHTDDRGRYELVTLVPGRYLNGDTYRPAHIHTR
jgi:hypothetical protein